MSIFRIGKGNSKNKDKPVFLGSCPFRPGSWYVYAQPGEIPATVRLQFQQHGMRHNSYDGYTSYHFIDEQGMERRINVREDWPPEIDRLSLEQEAVPNDLPHDVKILVERLLFGTAGERAEAAYDLGEMGKSAESALPWLEKTAREDVIVVWNDIADDTPRHIAKEAIAKISA